MQFTIKYNGHDYPVRLALLADGYFSAADAQAVRGVLAPLCVEPEAAAALGLAPGAVFFHALYTAMEDEGADVTLGREILLNTIVNACLAEGKSGGWDHGGTITPYPWASWSEIPRETTQAIIEAAIARLGAEDEEIARMCEFYAVDEDDEDVPKPRTYVFASESDALYWRFVHATGTIMQAERAMHEYSRHAAERFLVLKNMMGEKPESEEDDE